MTSQQKIAPTDFKLNEIVMLNDSNPNNIRVYRLPAFLIGGALKVVGYTKQKVKCDWDGGKPYHIPPELLKRVDA